MRNLALDNELTKKSLVSFMSIQILLIFLSWIKNYTSLYYEL